MNEVNKAIDDAIDEYFDDVANEKYNMTLSLDVVYDKFDDYIKRELAHRIMRTFDDEYGVRKVIDIVDTDITEYTIPIMKVVVK